MMPFGETVLAWRISRGMTQAALARAASIARPNLSAIERGERDVTLKTLRALAVALDVRPGILADGTAPGAGATPLSRSGLERIANAAVRCLPLTDAREDRLARHLRQAMGVRLRVEEGRRPGRPLGPRGERAYLMLKAAEGRDTAASLVDRASVALQRR